MQWLTRSIMFLGIGLSGCVSDDAIYANYGDLACGGIQIVEGDYWPSVVNFDFDDIALTQAETTKLHQAIRLLEKYPDLNVALVGSTDLEGSNKYNQKLANKRAKAVANYLSQKGIAVERLVVFGLGEEAPFVLTNDKATNRVNRRVNLILLNADFYPVNMRYNPADQL